MATKIRLQRGGRKGYAVYRIGIYNPNTNPATVDLNFERALKWVEEGAQPTDTVRSILRHEGVYLMKHLKGGVKKGAFDEAEAQKKFDAWKEGKAKGDDKVRADVAKAKKEAYEKELKAEKAVNESIAKKKVNEAIAEKVAAKKAEAKAAAEAAAAEAAADEAAAEQTEAPAEA